MTLEQKPIYGTPEWNLYYSAAAKRSRSIANAKRVRKEQPG